MIYALLLSSILWVLHLHCPLKQSEGHIQFLISSICINGEGNGTPLQYSCLENPMDGEAW